MRASRIMASTVNGALAAAVVLTIPSIKAQAAAIFINDHCKRAAEFPGPAYGPEQAWDFVLRNGATTSHLSIAEAVLRNLKANRHCSVISGWPTIQEQLGN